ncbi:MAG TPA: hypothetical protein DG753_07260 [Clostridium sp.]|nr:hypothetical protein [Clostridium sp.]
MPTFSFVISYEVKIPYRNVNVVLEKYTGKRGRPRKVKELII